MKGDEKRRQIRVFTSVPITFHMETQPDEMNSTMIDISLSGLRFTSKESLNIDDILKMKFILPNNLLCNFLGKIVTKLEKGDQHIYGINFFKQDTIERMNLSEYIMETRQQQEHLIQGRMTNTP